MSRIAIGKVMLLAVVCAALFAAAPTAASAGTNTYRFSNSPIHAQATFTSTRRGYGQPGQAISAICARTGPGVWDSRRRTYGYLWVYHRNTRTGVYGYTNSSYLMMYTAVRVC